MENTIFETITAKTLDLKDYDTIKQYDRDVRTWENVTEDEKIVMVKKAVSASRNKMLRKYSNVPMIDKLFIEEFNDLVSQTWVYAIKKAGKYGDEKTCFGIIFASALYAYQKILDERLGKRIQKRPGGKNGKAITVGRYTEDATDDIMTMKTKTERVFKTNDFIEMTIDMELTLTEEELK